MGTITGDPTIIRREYGIDIPVRYEDQGDGTWAQRVAYASAKGVEFGNHNADGNPIYMGEAPPGTLTSDPKWRIRKFTWYSATAVLRIQWAAGSAERDKVWDNRAGYTYS